MTERQGVVLGDSATITCAVTNVNNVPDSITWSDSAGGISNNDFYTVTKSSTSSTLVVKSVSPSTLYAFTCTMAFGVSSFDIEAEISVYEFDVAGDAVLGIAGASVLIPCKFESNSSTGVSATIQKSVNSVWTAQSDSIFSTSGNTTQGSLAIASADSSNEGKFRCSVTDSDGLTITSDPFNLDIFGKSSRS